MPNQSAQKLAAAAVSPAPRPKHLFLVTEDWYFCSDRLPFARMTYHAGCDIVVATRVRRHGEQIRAEGFALHPLAWRRSGDGVLASLRAVLAIARLYRAERPDIINHIALKPVLFGALAARLAFARRARRPLVVHWIMGLGSGFTSRRPLARLMRPALRLALRLAIAKHDWVVVQNPDDGAALRRLGIAAGRIVLIRGSGVDTSRFAALPPPAGPTVGVALVGRMIRGKGVHEAVAAVRRLRAEDMPVELLLAGAGDSDSGDSLTAADLQALAAEPGVVQLGRVADVREVWRRAAIAVLPSTYGEGLPRALIEAAACGRPIVTTDVPGCREAVRPGATGLLVPAGDVGALAAAIAALVRDPARRQAMGSAARALAEREFAESVIAAQTMAFYERVLRESPAR